MDRSGLAGVYDWEMTFAPEASDAALTDGRSIFTALQEQLGLRLEPTRAPVPFIVVVSAERPTPD